MRRRDAIVLGAGGVGSAAMLHLAKRGLRVTGIDRFQTPHAQGSSHGETRAIRQAYFEHPSYVPLLHRAYSLWDELEAEAEAKLFHRVGLLEAGPMDGIVVPGVLESADLYGLPVEKWTIDEARRQVPELSLDDSLAIVFEQNAGFLEVEACVDAHLRLAQESGAEFVATEIRSVTAQANSVEVVTDHGTFESAMAVVTAGPWAQDLLQHLQGPEARLPLSVVRKHLHWHPIKGMADNFESPRLPVFFIEEHEVQAERDAGVHDAQGTQFFYGFPHVSQRRIKIAEHSGGSECGDPLADSRTPEPNDSRRVANFVQRRLPGLSPTPCEHAVCFYTMTPDGNFIVDVVPARPHIAFAAGLSGHGFKFATALGETLAQLVTGEMLSCDIDFLRQARFAN